MAATHAVSLEGPDIERLDALTEAYPGATTHMALIGVVRIGLATAAREPALLATELSAIHAARRERRKAQPKQGEDSNG